MADGFSVTMTGVDELVKKLQGLKYDVQKRGGRFALRKAAQVIRDAARQNAQRLDDSETGRSIAKNITERWSNRYNKATGDLKFRVGVLGGARLPKNNIDDGAGRPTPHWRLLEFGTEKMEAHPLLRHAMKANAQRATDVFLREFPKAIDRALKRAGR